MLFLQFVLYSSSFVGTLKNEIPGAAPELRQLKIEQFSPDILKFSTKYKGNPLTLNFSKVSRTFLFIFYAGSRGLGSKNFWNSSYREKRAVRHMFPDYLSVSYDYGKTCCKPIKTSAYIRLRLTLQSLTKLKIGELLLTANSPNFSDLTIWRVTVNG